MTDDQIDRQVALLEGWRQVMVTPLEAAQRGLMPPIGSGMVEAWQCPNTGELRISPPFYSTHWSWCGPLVEKHNMEIERAVDGWRVSNCGPAAAIYAYGFDPSLRRAICLAVIAAQASLR